MMEHTPGPWTWNDDGEDVITINAPGGPEVWVVVPEDYECQYEAKRVAERHAERIVLCVNTHEELLQTASTLVVAIGSANRDDELSVALGRACAAIAKAEGR